MTSIFIHKWPNAKKKWIVPGNLLTCLADKHPFIQALPGNMTPATEIFISVKYHPWDLVPCLNPAWLMVLFCQAEMGCTWQSILILIQVSKKNISRAVSSAVKTGNNSRVGATRIWQGHQNIFIYATGNIKIRRFGARNSSFFPTEYLFSKSM